MLWNIQYVLFGKSVLAGHDWLEELSWGVTWQVGLLGRLVFDVDEGFMYVAGQWPSRYDC